MTVAIDERDLALFAAGRHPALDTWLGAHVTSVDGTDATTLAVWAPAARAVSVVGDFNQWDGRRHALQLHRPSGVWSVVVPGVGEGTRYMFDVHPSGGGPPARHADPMAFAAEPRPGTASVVHRSHHRWTDHDWMVERRGADPAGAPLSIYEVHLGSWRRHGDGAGRPLTYRELADQLPPYVHELGFTHVELMPVMAHPFGGSWGYQTTSYYAPNPLLGSPDELRALVDRLHQQGLGVILDWVPAHFPRDPWALARFDGTALYEHADPMRAAHPDWGTLIFDLGRPQVRNFLVANAVFWARRYHVDGLRVDAVASMLYRDYSRAAGQWTPNELGGREDLQAVTFLQELNDVLHDEVPGVLSVAEESTTWPGVTHPTERGGLGFDLKWNLGWMHDTLGYFAEETVHRRHRHRQLTFGFTYAFSERFLLPLSHDEVVHAKGSLITRMPGDRWQRFANLRALLAHQWAHPGKQLLFMGGELAQEREWDHDAQLEWELLGDADHAGVRALVADLNRTYRAHPALWELDDRPDGFTWLAADDADRNVLAYLRLGRDRGTDDQPLDGVPDATGEAAERAAGGGRRPMLACVANLSPVPRYEYRLGLAARGRWTEVLNTDSAFYGGSDVGNLGGVDAHEVPSHGFAWSALLTLPPLAVVWLAPETP